MRPRPASVIAIVPLLAALFAAAGVIGADARWLVAVGAHVAGGHLDGLPFATAPTSWHNAPALGELVFHWLYWALDDRGLVAAQAVAALIAFGALAIGSREEGATPAGTLIVGLVVALGSLPALVVVRNALFTLALYPLLLLLLERETVRPSRRIWWAVPLLLLWANLHGAVLVGFGLLGAYLIVSRRHQPFLVGGVLAGGALALCATPVLWHTPDYYLGVARNEAARTGVGLWAPLSTGLFDLAVVAAAVILVLLGRRSWRLWEAVAALGLAAATIHTARLGTWLLFVAAYPASRAIRVSRPIALPLFAPALVVVVVALLLVRGPADAGSRALAEQAARTQRPVLADAVAAEQVEVAGGKVWVANPIDAFRQADQRLYLDWLAGKPAGRSAVEHASLVLVRRETAAGRSATDDPRLRVLASDPQAVLYAVRLR